MKSIIAAFLFLTRVPVPYVPLEEKDLSKAVGFFPLVGAFEGIVCAGIVILFVKFFPIDPWIIATLGLIGVFLVRGIFHLDGLSDTLDACCVKPSGDVKKDVEKRLRIMKDSTVGVGGVVGIVFDLFLKISLLKVLIVKKFIFLPLILTYAFSRWIIAWSMYWGKAAKSSGLGYLLMKNLSIKEPLTSSLLIVAMCLILVKTSCLPRVFAFLLALLVFAILWNSFCKKNFSGLTGDTLGALVEISEVLSLFFWSYLW